MLEEFAALGTRLRRRVAHVMGSDLPPRGLDLRLDLLRPRRGASQPALTEAALAELLGPLRQNPAAYFPALLQQVRALNRYPLSQARRLTATVLMLQWFYRDAVQALRPMAKEPHGLPELEDSRAVLEAIADIARALGTSYQIIFEHDYGLGAFWYARLRARAFTCAFRILELTRFEQRVRALRYQPLPGQGWRIANTVFCAMRGCENVAFQLRLLDSDLREGKLAASCSLLDLYLSLQTFWLFDPCAWPNDQQSFIDTYRESVDQAARLDDDAGGALTPTSRVAYCYQEGPPTPKRLPEGLGAALVTDFAVLALSIRHDYDELVKDRAERNRLLIPRNLATLKPVYQVAIARLMVRALEHPGEWEDIREARAQDRDLHLYTSFGEVYAHLRVIFSGDRAAREARQLSDIFARRSAVFGDDHTASDKSRWFLLHTDERRLRIRTQETRFTNQMVIGTLLAFGFGEVEASRPHLARVTRILRPEAGTVVIDIDRLAAFARPVAVSQVAAPVAAGQGAPDAGAGKRQWIMALIGYEPAGGWVLAMPQAAGYWEGTRCDVRVGDKGFRCSLGALGAATPEFLLFGLPPLQRELVTPEYPQG